MFYQRWQSQKQESQSQAVVNSLVKPQSTKVNRKDKDSILPFESPSFQKVNIKGSTPIPLPAPSTSRRADILEADTPPRKRLLLTAPRPRGKVGESFAAAAARQPGPTMASVRAKIEILRRERLAYKQESIKTRQALVRSEAYSRALEAWITMLETQARRHEWQHQDADEHAVKHIMRTQTLEAGARVDTLEDTGSSA
ncbi:hypothetical protein Tco_1216725 [Tanacetum coccineum]